MEQEQFIEMDDGSNDKNYFTVIPNYILNHSSAIDQALYLQMKRLTNENTGKNICYPSFRYLKKQLKVGEITLKKSFKYLIEHKWISSLGKRRFKTQGGYQWVSTYKINDIWKINTEHYYNSKGVPSQRHQEENKVSLKTAKVSLKTAKVSPATGAKEYPIKEYPLKKNIIRKDQDIFDLIERFKNVNPSYERFFKNKTQRSAVERMLKSIGREDLENKIDVLEQTNKMKFAPVITTPLQLELKLGALIAFVNRKKITSSKVIKL